MLSILKNNYIYFVKNKKPQPWLLKNFKWVSLVLLIASLIFVYFIPRAIIYPDYKIIGWLQFVLILFIVPLFVFTTLVSFTKLVKLSAGIAAVTTLTVGLTFGLLQSYREKLELNRYGVWTKAIVIARKHPGNRNSNAKWMIKCSYVANNHTYETLYHDDINDVHPMGDTIKIIYSSQFPKIYALDYEWKR